MIDEMTPVFDSPGIVSRVFIITLYPEIRQMREGQTRATNNGNVLRGSSTLSGAPNWLAAESVSATQSLPPRCKMRMHAQCQCRMDE